MHTPLAFLLVLALQGAVVSASGLPLSCLCPQNGTVSTCLPQTNNTCTDSLILLEWAFELDGICGSKHIPMQCQPFCKAFGPIYAKSNANPVDSIPLFDFQGSWANFLVEIIMSLPDAQVGEIAATSNLIRREWEKLPHKTSATVFGAWIKQWSTRAAELYTEGERLAAAGQSESARSSFSRAFLYYFAAQWPAPTITHREEANSVRAFRKAYTNVIPFEAPWKGGMARLPAYFAAPENTTMADAMATRPTMIYTTGLDGSKEILFVQNGLSALKRGYNVIVYEGPGQGALARGINKKAQGFVPDWETVTEAVLEAALGIPMLAKQIDRKNIILAGLSLGGYLNGRACAYMSQNPKYGVKACILDTPITSVWELFGTNFVTAIIGNHIEVAKKHPNLVSHDLMNMLSHSYNQWWLPLINCPTGQHYLKKALAGEDVLDPDQQYIAMKFAKVETGNFTQLGAGAIDGILAGKPFVNTEISKQSVPTLCFGGTEDTLAGTQVKNYFRMLPENKYNKMVVFNATSGAALHCQVGAFAQYERVAYGWLDKVLLGL